MQVTTLFGEVFFNDLYLVFGVGLCRAVEEADLFRVGEQLQDHVCLFGQRSARSDVPETLPPTVPLKSVHVRAQRRIR